MMFQSLRNLFHKPARAGRRPRRLRFEQLEDRRLTAADIDLSNRVLSIQGTETDDRIQIEYRPNSQSRITATVMDSAFNVLERRTFARNRIDLAVVDALGGTDRVINRTNIPSQMNGGFGNDVLEGGSGPDTLDGGPDNDSLRGYEGLDFLYGRGGDDRLGAYAGGDLLAGGPDSDIYDFYGTQAFGTVAIDEAPNVDHDRLDFIPWFHAVTLDLSVTSPQEVSPGYLTLVLSSATAVENVWGSRYDDVISGNDRENELHGYDANDRLTGRAGLDTLDGGYGSDRLDGSYDGMQDVLIGGPDANWTTSADVFVRYGWEIPRPIGPPLRRIVESEDVRDFDPILDSYETIYFQIVPPPGPLTNDPTGMLQGRRRMR